MKLIQITNTHFADIDDKWCPHGNAYNRSNNKTSEMRKLNCTHGFGYYQVMIEGKITQWHCVIMQYHIRKGEPIPKGMVCDHINGDVKDNRPDNLRLVEQKINARNRKTTKGYSWNKACQKYKATVWLNNKNVHLGYFEKESDARQAFVLAAYKEDSIGYSLLKNEYYRYTANRMLNI